MPAAKRSSDESTVGRPQKRQCQRNASSTRSEVATAQPSHRYNLRKRPRESEEVHLAQPDSRRARKVQKLAPPNRSKDVRRSEKKRSVDRIRRRGPIPPITPLSDVSRSHTLATTRVHTPVEPSPSLAVSAVPEQISQQHPPRIFILDEPTPFPDLPNLTSSFRCKFLREINTSNTASVLLVSLPDGSERILKLFFPQPEGKHDPATAEYFAYCSLVAQGICRPPLSDTDATAATPRRFIPYCYGLLALDNLRLQMKCHSRWKSPVKKMLKDKPLYGLLIEYIPGCTTVRDDPLRLANQPALAEDFIAALCTIHAAGVIHRDPLPRNMMLDSEDGIWWVDFGSAHTTAYSSIHPYYFDSEIGRVKMLLRTDVIPAAREGRMARWEMLGQ
jgi:hypothetical protein